jgi:hypothetical protein
MRGRIEREKRKKSPRKKKKKKKRELVLNIISGSGEISFDEFVALMASMYVLFFNYTYFL